jgi:hypothetical protein
VTRALRITWTVFWGVVAVLLVALWVRSYWRTDSIVHENGHDAITVATDPGAIIFETEWYPALEVNSSWNRRSECLPTKIPAAALPRLAFAWQRHTNWSSLLVPIWFPVLTAGLIGIAPWVRWSICYSLRALLLFATLVAVVLGFMAVRY